MILKLNKFSKRNVTTTAYKLYKVYLKSFMFITLESEQLLLKVSDHKMSTIGMCSLSKTRLAYARMGELIIRDRTMIGAFKAFGVKGRENLLNLYYGSLTLLRANRAKILQMDERKYAFLSHFLDSLGVEDVQEMDKLKVNEADKKLRLAHLQFVPFIQYPYPRICLCVDNFDDMHATWPYEFLSVDQLVKLLKWMNRTQDIGVTKFGSYDTSNDDFIDLVRD